jgi:hypothetical protein
LDSFQEQHLNIIIETAVQELRKHRFDAHAFSDRDALLKFIMDHATGAETVGVAGTHTVRALGIVSMMETAGKTIFDHWRFKPGDPEELACRRKQLTCDLFITSANAITMTGEIVNKDGCGNRINSMTFGPKKVIVVVGKNKVVSDLDAALTRIEEFAAPIRATSLNRKTPCVKTAQCMDCDSPERICNITSIIHRKPMMTDLKVAIISEDLGY